MLGTSAQQMTDLLQKGGGTLLAGYFCKGFQGSRSLSACDQGWASCCSPTAEQSCDDDKHLQPGYRRETELSGSADASAAGYPTLPRRKKRSVSPVKQQRPMFREGQTLPLKDMVELDRRWKLMEGTKPWTLANRIKLLTTRSVRASRSTRAHLPCAAPAAIALLSSRGVVVESILSPVRGLRNGHVEGFSLVAMVEAGDEGRH